MISQKQQKILSFPYSDYTVIIADGAVRSGKTSILTWAFVDWAMRCFNGQRFGICGKTVTSAFQNIVQPFMSMTYAQERYQIKFRRSDKIIEIKRGNAVNWFEVFGGKDESSYQLIQGRTLAGVLLDEVVLMPESFVNQALARCSVPDAKLWFSCNPDNPGHWFYNKWILDRERHNALYLHFTMHDNPSLTKETLDRYESMYDGVFYQRYVLGEWVAADGLVYPMFSVADHVIDEIPWQAVQHGRWYVSIDYGTVNPCAMELWTIYNGAAYLVQESYYDSRKPGNIQRTDEEHYAELARLVGNRRIDKVVVDPSAASFKTTIRKYGRFSVWDAQNDVINGIRFTATALKSGRIKIHSSCVDCIREFQSYMWDSEAAEDAVIKENDHAMDSVRYLCCTILSRYVR